MSMPTPFRTSQLEENDGPGHNPTANRTMGEIIAARFSRRELLKGSLAVSAIAATVGPTALVLADVARAAGAPSAFSFAEVEAGIDDRHHVAAGYDADVLLRWGDPIFADAPEFDPASQSAEAQAKQFGYNNDYVGFIPIDGSAEHGLLVVNHEYTNPHLMFPGIVSVVEADGKKKIEQAPLTREQVDIEIAAHGGSIVEIRKEGGKWQVVRDGKLNRRITADTPMQITGPAAGSDRLKTSADPTGTRVIGTVNDCAGGVTPWGTWIMAEENIHGYFGGTLSAGHREAQNYERLGIPEGSYEWAAHYDRYDVGKEPNEPNRFGWIVEVDVGDPDLDAEEAHGARPLQARGRRIDRGRGRPRGVLSRRRRALRLRLQVRDRRRLQSRRSRREHGSARRRHAPRRPLRRGRHPGVAADRLRRGTADGRQRLRQPGRRADRDPPRRRPSRRDQMDRPEDVQPNAKNGKVYVMLTNNTKRAADQVDAANPRAKNAFGHIIEIEEAGGDFAATEGRWEVLLKCGDPSVADVGATFSTATTANGWFGMPDNCAVDSAGRLWVSTDGNSPKATGRTDGLWAVDTEGEARATSKLFFRVPVGAELCGPLFSPDDTTAFVAVQHPGDGGEDWEGFGRVSYYEDLSTRWPDFRPDMPVRPSVVAITRQDGGRIAG